MARHCLVDVPVSGGNSHIDDAEIDFLFRQEFTDFRFELVSELEGILVHNQVQLLQQQEAMLRQLFDAHGFYPHDIYPPAPLATSIEEHEVARPLPPGTPMDAGVYNGVPPNYDIAYCDDLTPFRKNLDSEATLSAPPTCTSPKTAKIASAQTVTFDDIDDVPKTRVSDAVRSSVMDLHSVRGSFLSSNTSHTAYTGHTSPTNPASNKRKSVKVTGAFGNIADLDNFGASVYESEDFYYTEGYPQKIARNENFGNITLAVIAVNAIYIGIDVEKNESSSPLDLDYWEFLACDNVFCFFFVFEIIVRFLAFRFKSDCLKDTWFKFDTLLVTLMVAETWLVPFFIIVSGINVGALPSGPLRLLRLLRLSRMARLMRMLPELVTMLKGVKVASRAVGSCLLIAFLLIYVFGIVMNMILRTEERVNEHFGTLPRTMWTLFVDGTLMDSTTVLSYLVYIGEGHTFLAATVFVIFILLSAMTIMNMLIGVLCEVVSSVAAAEKHEGAVRMMKETIVVQLRNFDSDGNGMICKEELQHVMEDVETTEVLESLQVDVEYLKELQQTFFEHPDSEVSIEHIMDLMLELRGDLPTTQKHMVRGQRFTRWTVANTLRHHEEQITKVLAQVTQVMAQFSFRKVQIPPQACAISNQPRLAPPKALPDFISGVRKTKVPSIQPCSANGIDQSDDKLLLSL